MKSDVTLNTVKSRHGYPSSLYNIYHSHTLPLFLPDPLLPSDLPHLPLFISNHFFFPQSSVRHSNKTTRISSIATQPFSPLLIGNLLQLVHKQKKLNINTPPCMFPYLFRSTLFSFRFCFIVFIFHLYGHALMISPFFVCLLPT